MYRELPDGLSDQPIFLTRYSAIRALTEQLAAPLGPGDQFVQSMPDASPTKWHLAHTTVYDEYICKTANRGDIFGSKGGSGWDR